MHRLLGNQSKYNTWWIWTSKKELVQVMRKQPGNWLWAHTLTFRSWREASGRWSLPSQILSTWTCRCRINWIVWIVPHSFPLFEVGQCSNVRKKVWENSAPPLLLSYYSFDNDCLIIRKLAFDSNSQSSALFRLSISVPIPSLEGPETGVLFVLLCAKEDD